MSNEEQIARAVTFGLSVLALLAAYFYVLVPASTSLFRQELFRIRRDLFIAAASGLVTFRDPAYTRLRFTINISLQYAERLSWERLLFISLCARVWTMNDSELSLDDHIAGLPAPARELLDRLQFELGMAIVGHFRRTGLFAVLFIGLLQGLGLLRGLALRIEHSMEALSHGEASANA